jgi:hypothetical protein
MNIAIQGNRLYVDNYHFSHCEVKDGNGHKPFNGTAEPRYSHHHGEELLHVDGLGWCGPYDDCSIVLGRVVKGDGSVMGCRTTHARMIGMANYAAEQGKKITLEIAQ